LPVFPIHAQENGHRHAVGEDAGAAEAHQRQGQALGRQQAHVDAHVDEGLNAQPDADAHGHQGGVQTVELDALTADGEGALDNDGEQGNHQQHTDETEFLGDHRQQEIGMGFRQVEEFLDTAAEADAEQFTTAEGDQRMRQLVAAAEGIGPRIHETDP